MDCVKDGFDWAGDNAVDGIRIHEVLNLRFEGILHSSRARRKIDDGM